MAEFSFEGLKKGITEKVNEVSSKTSAYMEVNRLKTYIGSLEKDMAKLKETIGSKVYEAWKQENAPFDITQELEHLKALDDEILEQNRRIAEIEAQNRQITGEAQSMGVRYCSSCGTACSAEAAFCKNCGAKL